VFKNLRNLHFNYTQGSETVLTQELKTLDDK